MALKYSSTQGFNEFLGSVVNVPDYPNVTTPEEVGTGDDSQTVFYLDFKGVINGTYALSYGASASSLTALVETTDYTIDLDKSQITLTAGGVTKVSTNNIYAVYEYNNQSKLDSFYEDVLERAESEIDARTDTVFADGTSATPTYTAISNELTKGLGDYQTVYQLDKYPINSATTTLDGAVSVDDSTVTVVSTNGFPSSGTFAIDSEKFTYSSKDATTFTLSSNATAAHDDASEVTSYVFERSVDGEGTAPTFTVLQKDVDYSVDELSGNVKITSNDLVSNAWMFDNPPDGVWNRFRASYQYGYDTIPEEIVRCVYMIASNELFTGQVMSALGRGTDGFDTDSANNIHKQIDMIINKYKCILVSNITENR